MYITSYRLISVQYLNSDMELHAMLTTVIESTHVRDDRDVISLTMSNLESLMKTNPLIFYTRFFFMYL